MIGEVMNRHELWCLCVIPLWCLALVCGCGAKKEPQSANITQTAQQAQTLVPKEQDSPSAEDWPRQITKGGNRLTYYQPQIDSWKDYRQLGGRVAVVLTSAGGESVTGMIILQAQTDTVMEDRTVVIHDIRVTDAFFPSLDEPTQQKMRSLSEDLLPKEAVPISLDRMLAAMEDQAPSSNTPALQSVAPKIFVSIVPAILLLVDGSAVKAPIPQTSMEIVVNANWDLFFDSGIGSFYLAQPPLWLQSSTLDGPWVLATSLPPDMAKLPEDWAEAKKSIPLNLPPNAAAPRVFYSDGAAELIAFDGEPKWAPIPGTNLAYASNTDSDFFIDNSTNRFYYLSSGRWFSSLQRTGPWTFASDRLPTDFAKIPTDSPAADILPSVPGTDAARDAVMMAQIPTLAVVNKADAAAAVKVAYQGEPQFKPIEATRLSYAINTDSKVIKVGDLYYLCFQGVWFMSRSANGPWETATTVPAAIYQIPPSSPVYNVTYVRIYETTSQTVTCGYTSGYTGTFVLGLAVGATIAYGTGYRYPPYVYYPPRPYPVPYYVGYPRTYGVGVHYNYYSGGYYAQRSVYGPYGTASRAAWYNPSTGFYGRAATVQTVAGGATIGQAYNPWTGTYAATRQGSNAYSQWGSSVAIRGDQWAQAAHRSTINGTVAGIRTSEGAGFVGGVGRGGSGFVARDKDNNVYAGKDGNVYKKDPGGNWQKYGNAGWSGVNPPTTQYKTARAPTKQSATPERPTTQLAKTSAAGTLPSAPLRNTPAVSAQTRPSAVSGGSSSRPSQVPAAAATLPSVSAPSRGTPQARPSVSQQPTAAANPISQLDRDAAARQRGTQQAQQYQRNRQNIAAGPGTGTQGAARARGLSR
jgi:hypothetical protein